MSASRRPSVTTPDRSDRDSQGNTPPSPKPLPDHIWQNMARELLDIDHLEFMGLILEKKKKDEAWRAAEEEKKKNMMNACASNSRQEWADKIVRPSSACACAWRGGV